jgi:YesN/AraC family two-component response regulator
MKKKDDFPYYQEINDYLQSFSSLKAHNPLFYCLRLLPNNQTSTFYKPPFRRGFYLLALVNKAKKNEIYFDNIKIKKPQSYLVLQSPGLLFGYTYNEGESEEGYAVYFKSECFSFLKNSFNAEFSFFDFINTSFFELSEDAIKSLEPYFHDFFVASKMKEANKEQIVIAKLLVLLYAIKDFIQGVSDISEKQFESDDALFQKYLLLISRHYIEKRTVKEYAVLLSISPNYLSQLVKKQTNRNALSFINEKIINEAKSSILHSKANIGKIAKQLNFSDTSNFVKFFKSKTGKTPMEYRGIKG